MNSLYRKLAFTNIRNSRHFYLPYLLAGVLSAMMFYNMSAIRHNEGLEGIRGAVFVIEIMGMGTWIIAIFVSIFLFYTNSFIMKRRKKELGVYNILGMEKKHIVRVLFWESLFTLLVTVGGGLVAGILFNKFLTMLLYWMTGLAESIPFYISRGSCVQTATLFGAICVATLIYNFMQIQMANPIELLRSTNAGEREPKTKMLMAVLGVVCIGGGYFISITTTNPIQAILLFFVAVLLVIIGTYCIFTAGSIAFLKILRKNKRYYYQTRHFTTVSGMIYRMKQNAVGLANICILSTMVLVMVSTTVSMYAGLEDELDSRCPRELAVTFEFETVPSKETTDRMLAELKECITENGRLVQGQGEVTDTSLMMQRVDGNRFDLVDGEFFDYSRVTMAAVMTRESCEAYFGIEMEEIKDGEAVIVTKPHLGLKTVIFNGREYRVAEELELHENEDYIVGLIEGVMYLVVKDDAELQRVYENLSATYASQQHRIGLYVEYQIGIDIDGTPQEKLECLSQVRADINTWQVDGVSRIGEPFVSFHVESREEDRESFLSQNGALLFLGMFLGMMFLMETVLIIYYKQISEGYEDKERYAIMERVGMSNTEVKASINSQVRTVFFLPLVTAVIHLAAAFPLLKRLLSLLNLTNSTVFVWCLAGTVVVFAVIYLGVFMLTSKSYYKIVGNQV